MAHYVATVITPMSIEDAFGYLSDFSTTEEWDPGVVRAERLDSDLAIGCRFEVVVKVAGREVPFTYRLTEYDPPHHFAVRATTRVFTSFDRLSFQRSGGNTTVVYDATLSLNGVMRVADPLLQIAFNRVADQGLAGLKEKLKAA